MLSCSNKLGSSGNGGVGAKVCLFLRGGSAIASLSAQLRHSHKFLTGSVSFEYKFCGIFLNIYRWGNKEMRALAPTNKAKTPIKNFVRGKVETKRQPKEVDLQKMIINKLKTKRHLPSSSTNSCHASGP